MSVARTARAWYLRPTVILGLVLVALFAGVAATTKVVRPGDEVAVAGEAAFDAVQYAEERYESEVVPAIIDDAIPLTELLPQIAEDPEAAGEQYGHRAGSTSPWSYATTVTGVAGDVDGTYLPLEVDGLPDGVRVMVQVGPAINGTALRDATGLIDFNDFLNQIEYANAATELNNKVKETVLADLDPAALKGQEVQVTGAFSYGPNPGVVIVTPVEMVVAP
jgi:predicted lipoprotein